MRALALRRMAAQYPAAYGPDSRRISSNTLRRSFSAHSRDGDSTIPPQTEVHNKATTSTSDAQTTTTQQPVARPAQAKPVSSITLGGDRDTMELLYRRLFQSKHVDQTDLEVARSVFKGPAKFLKSSRTWKELPVTDRTEIAFIGRTNVGKSSLLNALLPGETRLHDMARPSSNPGFTKMINAFLLGGKLMLVDLPGYGFKSTEHQMNMIGSYITKRPSLHSACVLIDASTGIKEIDQYVMSLLDDHKKSYQVVLTKADKLSPEELRDSVGAIQNTRDYISKNAKLCFTIIQPVSSKRHLGIDHLKHWLLVTSGFHLRR